MTDHVKHIGYRTVTTDGVPRREYIIELSAEFICWGAGLTVPAKVKTKPAKAERGK